MRRLLKFENLAGTISYTFSTKLLESQEEVGLRTAFSAGVGADFSHDHHGYGAAPKGNRLINVRAMLVEASPTALADEMDEARAECYRIGLGYLYRVEADGSTQRRCLARVNAIPSVTINNLNRHGAAPIIIQFVAISDWMATTATTGSQAISANPTLVTITNAGNIAVKSGIVFTLTATAAGGFSSPEIYNATTGERVSSTRYAAVAGAIWRVGNPDYAVAYGRPALMVGKSDRYIGHSTVGPGNLGNDYSLVTLAGGGFPTLEPGANSIYVFGATAATFEYSFYGAFV